MKLNPKLWIDRKPIDHKSDRVRHFTEKEIKESYKLKKSE
jgi:hypothetical protein